jgi:ketosteroid isomerase-like protein
MPPNHPAVEGRDNIRGFLQGLIDAGATGIKLITASVSSAGDVAWERGAYVLSMAPAGGAGAEDRGKYIVCYRRRPDGSWRAVADIFNSDQAGH